MCSQDFRKPLEVGEQLQSLPTVARKTWRDDKTFSSSYLHLRPTFCPDQDLVRWTDELSSLIKQGGSRNRRALTDTLASISRPCGYRDFPRKSLPALGRSRREPANI
jgi:hypothetical protein